MKRFLKHIVLFFIPVYIGVVALFIFPVEKKFSYSFIKGECNNKASWIYNRIFIDNRNVDIAFSGASQTGCAIMDELIEKELNKNSGRELSVANIGYCRRGRDIQYLMLKDLFENKKPKIIIVEVYEDEPKKSHPVFPYLANSDDLFSSGILFNQRYLSGIWKGGVVRFENFKHIVFKTEIQPLKNPLLFGYRHSIQKVADNVLMENRTVWEKRLARHKNSLLRKFELNYSKHYLEKIVKLANQNSCKILFLYLPESGSKLKEPLLTKYYKNFGELVVLPQSIIENKENWKDATHFNDLGAIKVSQFIENKLLFYTTSTTSTQQAPQLDNNENGIFPKQSY
jgi:hypothetical protein